MSEIKEATNALAQPAAADKPKAKGKGKKKAATSEPIPLMAGPLPLHSIKFDALAQEARRITLEHRANIYKVVLEQGAENKSLADIDAAAAHLSRDVFLDALDQDVLAFTQLHNQVLERFSKFSTTHREGLPVDNGMAAYLSQQVAAIYQAMLLAIDTRANLVNQRNVKAPTSVGPVGGVSAQVKNTRPDEV